MIRIVNLMTVDEFYEFVNRPENDPRWFELVEGHLVEWPPPNRRHGFVTARIGYLFCRHARRICKGNVAIGGAGVILNRNPDTVRGPDVACYEAVLRFDDLPERWGDVPPRLAVEVLMPADRAGPFLRKVSDYLEYGVEVVWVVNPETRTVTIYSKTEGVISLTDKDSITGGDVLPGFKCKVADFFVLPRTAKKPKRKRS